MTSALPLVLLVDDEPSVISGVRRNLLRTCRTVGASSGDEALQVLKRTEEPIAAIVSDLRMPSMLGTELLRRVAERDPAVTRVLLTGYADLDMAIDAIQYAKVFRLLLKPCPSAVLVDTVTDALEQNRLMRAERELLDLTLRGCVSTLVDTLALANPHVFARAVRLGRLATAIAEQAGVRSLWEVEVAATLSQIGATTLPDNTVMKLHEGLQLTGDERQEVARLPAIAEALLEPIPRLERVRRMIALAGTNDPSAAVAPADEPAVELGAVILCVARVLDGALARGLPFAEALAFTTTRVQGPVAARVTEVAAGVVPSDRTRPGNLVPATDLVIGMVLAADLQGANGALLLGRGQAVTHAVLERLMHHRQLLGPDAMVEIEASEELPDRLAALLR